MRARGSASQFMQILLTTSVLLAVAWVLHILLWKIRLPRHQIPSLLLISSAVLAAWIMLDRSGLLSKVSALEACQTVLLYGASSLCYVITYSAVEGDSPTLSLTRLLADRKNAGLPQEDVEGFLAARPFVKARLAALIHSGLIREEAGKFCIAGRPSLSFRLILAYRKLYGSVSRGG